MPQENCKRPQQKHKEAHEDEPKGSKQVGHSVTNCNKYSYSGFIRRWTAAN